MLNMLSDYKAFRSWSIIEGAVLRLSGESESINDEWIITFPSLLSNVFSSNSIFNPLISIFPAY